MKGSGSINTYFKTFGTSHYSFEKTLMLRKTEGGRKGTTEDEMVGWHYRLNRHESE